MRTLCLLQRNGNRHGELTYIQNLMYSFTLHSLHGNHTTTTNQPSHVNRPVLERLLVTEQGWMSHYNIDHRTSNSIRTAAHAHMCTHTHMHTHAHTHTTTPHMHHTLHARACPHTDTHVHTHAHALTRGHTHRPTHTHIHTCTHTRTLVQVHSPVIRVVS